MDKVFLNGQILDAKDAKISIMDRSILFSDAVYEVISVLNKEFLDFHAHMKRLQNSLKALEINFLVDETVFLNQLQKLITHNAFVNGTVYIQISRGHGIRNFLYDTSFKPTLFMFTQKGLDHDLLLTPCLKMMSYKEGRWERRDIKTTQLLYSSLAKTKAHQKGVDDAVYVEDGFITEATSSNFHIIDKEGTFVTRPLDGSILPGITRATLINLAKKNHCNVEERLFSLKDVFEAKEAFISSASTFATAVTHIDGKMIGNGKAGETTKWLRKLYLDHVERSVS
ncbi:aminotransferase class IV [Bartonella tamiae]|uniref:Probable branched-chain-amino-acid aminotransferase n=1 Tax=Bartonella tamiae Th239 TaxID=1094558 RepID=J1K376_9HYPH|nr:aminotransferase class IV [Bartonella tamiae]EJF91575.1 D-amino-acid transaminase [Bartonella tamiae Th239]EJF92441.1 D-amino-acid transaminase [Bartonella tamiae Th307]